VKHLNLFSRFCRAHPLCPTDRHTQTTLRVISVAIGHIYAMHVVQPNYAN